MKNIREFAKEITAKYKSGEATEHTYRAALEKLIRGVSCDKLMVLNEGKTEKKGLGKPDLVVKNGDILIGCAEAKDIDKDLSDPAYEEQFTRYKNGIENLVITNCLDWELYKNGELKQSVTIGSLSKKGIDIHEKQLDRLLFLLQEFTEYKGLKITSSKNLATIMANRTRALKILIEDSLKNKLSRFLTNQFERFDTYLMKGIDISSFADMYAQTITYGLFVSWLNNENSETFSRAEAIDGVSNNISFLRRLFKVFTERDDVGDSLNWDIDNLIALFGITDRKLFSVSERKDLFIHFYEDFLTLYDKKVKVTRGVYYTPPEVVGYIVNAVDELLQTEFKLRDGLADSTKTSYEYKENDSGIPLKDNDADCVQILDPATGTGTFLVEVVRKIHERIKIQRKPWNKYVAEHLLDNLHGFELLMTPYVMCHLKLNTVLRETGYDFKESKEYKLAGNKKYKICLTNSLDQSVDAEMNDWFGDEANLAKYIKKYRPIKVVIGNPPYSVSSFNKSKFITDLIGTYKTGLGVEKERNIQPLSDDYVKFIRLAENYIARNKCGGIVAFITNNSFLDGLIHRQMRKHLLETFDKIYIVNLHGNSRRQETSPDGSKDENVFDIQPGVSINIFVRTTRSKGLAKLYYKDVYGERQGKYGWLCSTKFSETDFVELEPKEKYYFFVPKDFSSTEESYNEGFSVNDLFIKYVCGVQTKRDELFVDNNAEPLKRRIGTLLSNDNYPEGFVDRYNVRNSSSYNLLGKIKKVKYNEGKITKYRYRPFDCRCIYYDENLLGRPFYDVMQHFIHGENLGLCTCRQQSTFDFQHVLVTNGITDMCYVSAQGSESAYVYPLYIYDPVLGTKSPNFNEKEGGVLRTLESKLGIKLGAGFTPENLLDYIYGILHSNEYRRKYKELLRIDFPRVPYPKNKDYFFKIAGYGEMLRSVHLLKPGSLPPSSSDSTGWCPIEGNYVVTDVKFKDGKVYINKTQYFDNVPENVWNFYIGGYQPLKKWLQYRKEDNSVLTYDDIDHCIKMVSAIAETIRIMGEIDRVVQL